MMRGEPDNTRLKQRLIGATVIVALLVIFLPMLLLEDHGGQTVLDNAMPPSPFGMRDQVLGRDKWTFSPLEQDIQMPKSDSAAIEEQLDSLPDIIESPPEQTPPEPTVSATEKRLESTPSAPVPVPVPVPVESENPAGQWAVQVGSFSIPDNAFKLRNTLRKKGYDVFIDRWNSSSGEKLRVRIGPLFTRSDAGRVRKQLADKEKIEGIVTRYP